MELGQSEFDELKWGVLGEVKVPENPVCPYCHSAISCEEALEMEAERIYMQRIEGPFNFRWDDPFAGFWQTKPWHCIEQASAADKADRASRGARPHREVPIPIRPGRMQNPEITRIAKERGVSRDAARKWLKRH